MTIEWFGAEVERLLARQRMDNLDRAGSYLVGAIQRELSRPSGSDPSRPGEPPKEVTGRLKDSIGHALGDDQQSCRVGTSLPYGKLLELGAPHRGLAPRPYLRVILSRCRAEIMAILAGQAVPGAEA